MKCYLASYSGLGEYHSRILDQWAADTGHSEGATAEKGRAAPGPSVDPSRSSAVLRGSSAGVEVDKRTRESPHE